MNRVITPNEAAIVRWLLGHAPVGDVTAYRPHKVEELLVFKGCDCGCSSLDFQPNGWIRADVVSDALAVYSDGQQAGLILWGREGEFVYLEVYDCHPEASHRVPDISNLRTFEERRLELL